jgi:hypothetical protein
MLSCRCPRRGRPRPRPALALCLLLLTAAFAPPRAHAQTYRWDNGGSGTSFNRDNAANWFNITLASNDGVRPPGADVQFGIGYTVSIVFSLNSDRTVNSLAFGVPAQTALSGNTLAATSGLITVYATQFSGTDPALPPTGGADAGADGAAGARGDRPTAAPAAGPRSANADSSHDAAPRTAQRGGELLPLDAAQPLAARTL